MTALAAPVARRRRITEAWFSMSGIFLLVMRASMATLNAAPTVPSKAMRNKRLASNTSLPVQGSVTSPVVPPVG